MFINLVLIKKKCINQDVALSNPLSTKIKSRSRFGYFGCKTLTKIEFDLSRRFIKLGAPSSDFLIMGDAPEGLRGRNSLPNFVQLFQWLVLSW